MDWNLGSSDGDGQKQVAEATVAKKCVCAGECGCNVQKQCMPNTHTHMGGGVNTENKIQ